MFIFVEKNRTMNTEADVRLLKCVAKLFYNLNTFLCLQPLLVHIHLTDERLADILCFDAKLVNNLRFVMCVCVEIKRRTNKKGSQLFAPTRSGQVCGGKIFSQL